MVLQTEVMLEKSLIDRLEEQGYKYIEIKTEEAILNSATKLVPKNSILIVFRVGVGKVAV